MSKEKINKATIALSKELVKNATIDKDNGKITFDTATAIGALPKPMTDEAIETYQSNIGTLTMASELAAAEIGADILTDNKDLTEVTSRLAIGNVNVETLYAGKSTQGETEVFGHTVTTVQSDYTGEIGEEMNKVRAHIGGLAASLFGAK